MRLYSQVLSVNSQQAKESGLVPPKLTTLFEQRGKLFRSEPRTQLKNAACAAPTSSLRASPRE